MAVESNGTILFKGESGPGHPVRVRVEPGRIRIEAGSEVIGDWSIHDIGLVVGDDGFSIRAEGEEFLLRAEDDVAIAEELGVAAASPRMARRVAARHNPDRPLPQDQEGAEEPESKLSAIGLALSGAMVIAGATLLDTVSVEPGSFDPGAATLGGMRFWVAFLVGGIALVFFAFLMSIGATWARIPAVVTIASEVLLFGLLVNRGSPDPAALIAYGFVAGGMVVGVAVIFSGRPGISD